VKVPFICHGPSNFWVVVAGLVFLLEISKSVMKEWAQGPWLCLLWLRQKCLNPQQLGALWVMMFTPTVHWNSERHRGRLSCQDSGLATQYSSSLLQESIPDWPVSSGL
jgi:hypothetical protein